MIDDLALRWVVTGLFVFVAGVCVTAIVRNRHRPASVISHALHGAMAVAMAVMAWPDGAALPSRAPMIFFAAAGLWFAGAALAGGGHRVANGYHTLMMAAMAWMYAAMGGLPLRRGGDPAGTAMAGMGGSSGHAGHAGHGGHAAAMSAGSDPDSWITTLNTLCAVGFAVAAVFWLSRLVIARIGARIGAERDDADSVVGILCQLAMAAGMAIMFAVMI